MPTPSSTTEMKRAAALLQGDGDAVRAGVDGVLDQLLHRARRTLDHLARGDAVDQGRRQASDGEARSWRAQFTSAAVRKDTGGIWQTAHQGSRGDADRLADDDRGQRLVAQQAAGEPADVVDLDRARSRRRAWSRWSGGRLSTCMECSRPAIALDEIERQRQRAGEIGLGVGEFLLGRPVGAQARQLGRARRAAPRRPARWRCAVEITSSAGLAVDAQAARGAVGQAALLAHLAEQPRLLAAAARMWFMTRAAYQSGSSRATPGSAISAVLCGTGRSTTTVRALVGGCQSGGSGWRRADRQAAEGAVEQAARARPRRCRRPRPRSGRCAISSAAARCLRFCGVSFFRSSRRAVGIVGVGMAGELGRHQRARGDRAGPLVGLVDRRR